MTQRMLIIAGYLEGQAYGLLGPQIAATLIRDHTPYDCMVMAVPRDYEPLQLKKAISDYFENERPVIGFSNLNGHRRLFLLAEELKNEGAITILAGPQARVDFTGEAGWRRFPHRFPGWKDAFTLAIQGPAEQLFPLLRGAGRFDPRPLPGISWYRRGRILSSPPARWQEDFLKHVDWSDLYVLQGDRWESVQIEQAQVIGAIGCPWARYAKTVALDYPSGLDPPDGEKSTRLRLKGCSFCDVARDKGYMGTLSIAAMVEQIKGLPARDGCKIPFELINENPLPGLTRLLSHVRDTGICLSRIDLVTRSDWIVKHRPQLEEALGMSKQMNIRICLSSIGFESFHNRVLSHFNKGVTVDVNLAAIRLIRDLKKRFPANLQYSRGEGANHGFIHPTPWDRHEEWQEVLAIMRSLRLEEDIIPRHSTPLIIHHASPLGTWIRMLEKRTGLAYPRQNTWISWWDDVGAMMPRH